MRLRRLDSDARMALVAARVAEAVCSRAEEGAQRAREHTARRAQRAEEDRAIIRCTIIRRKVRQS
jgi:hypothetical protein